MEGAWSPFAGLGAAQVAALFAIYFGSFVIRGVFGFGSVTPAILLGALVVPPHHAVLLALVGTIGSQLHLLPDGIRDGDWRIARPLLAASLAAIAAGVYVFREIEGKWLILTLGVALGFTVVADMTRVMARLARRVDLRSTPVALLLAAVVGLITGVTGGGALYFLAVYVRWAAPEPRTFRGTNLLLTALFTLWRLVATLVAGLITPSLVIEGLLLTPATILAGWAGRRIAGRIPAERYFRAFQVLLVGAAASVIWKGLAAFR